MKQHGILNSHISKVLSDMGHTDQLTIADCGLPIPNQVDKIDLAIDLGFPSFLKVLDTVKTDMKIETIYLAEEIKVHNPQLLQKIIASLGEDMQVHFISHQEFKERTAQSKAIIRTGEATPYANIILESGVIF